MPRSVIVAGARTPIGRLLGGLADLRGTDLGGLAVAEALARSGVPATQVDAVVMGNVVQAGGGPNPARQAAVAGGIPFQVPATTINKLCLSGLASIAYADQLIRLGQYDTVVAGGFESMTNAPHLLLQSRRGTKYGPARLTDALDQDGLICAFDGVTMGVATERYQSGFGLTRAMLDEFAAASHGRATAAMKSDRLAEEIVAVRSPTHGVLIEHDEGVRPGLSTEQLSKLRPAFTTDGLITAGSSSPLSDGAAAVVVMNRDRAEQLGLTWLAEIGAYGTVAGPIRR